MSLSLCLNGFNGSPFIGGDGDVESWVEATAQAGFTLFAPDKFSLTAYQARGGTLTALARRMRDAGVGCGFIGAAAVLGAAELAQDMAFSRQAAETLGAGFVQVNGIAPHGPARVAALRTACAALAGSGIRLAMEYMPFTALARAGETADLAALAGENEAGVVVDLWHHAHGPDTWADLVALPLSSIAYLEFSDAPPVQGADLAAETLNRRVFPGEGVLDAARFAQFYRQAGYAGMVSVEVLNAAWRQRPAAEQAARAFASAAPYWLHNGAD